ncbi:uncharacterized protein LOC108863626 [Galendromus occidentalis]|uniref:Uncharacterized protein LOC108863626 n=1 Tax=Galendromus occidentalis TaxID=34638 RepID=A0AAJ6VZ57_9ACAR|nr:uncharacterized protein LOC108863626 [Galendromus occidentalis]
MRSFAVIATFLLVAQAQAFDAKETIQCIQNHMQTALNNSFDDIGDRFDNIDGHRQELTKSLRNELEEIRDTFQENLEKRMQEIDTNCDEEEGMINKAKCASASESRSSSLPARKLQPLSNPHPRPSTATPRTSVVRAWTP